MNFTSITLGLLLSAFCLSVNAQSDVQRSHIEANVSPPDSFERLLVRDLTAYFRRSTGRAISTVKITRLRDAPTQSGAAYPKYYFWVRVTCDSMLCAEGAVRAAAIERERFEVTDFLSKDVITASPADVGRIFPVALNNRIYELAGLNQK